MSSQPEKPSADLMLDALREKMRQMQALSSRIAIINEVTELIHRNLSLEQILRVVRQHTKWLIDYDHLSVTLPDNLVSDGTPRQWIIHTLHGEDARSPIGENDDQVIGFALRLRRMKLVNDGAESPIFRGCASQIVLPLMNEDTVIGTLNIARQSPNAYTMDDVRIAYAFALQLAGALRNAAHLEKRRQAEATLRTYAAQLETQNDELDWFNAMIAHDLKAPLSVIYGYLAMLEIHHAETKDPDPLRYVNEISEAAQGMNQMIERLLNLARLHHDTPPRPVSVNESAHRVMTRFKHAIEYRHIPIQIEIQPDILRVIGYDAWIEEILANLIGNAILYIGEDNPQPRICVTGALDANASDGEMIRCEVCDNGVGIDEAGLTKVVQMFSRVHIKSKGHGLGLFIVQRFVRQLGGRVGVESEKGVGSTFWFTLRKG